MSDLREKVLDILDEYVSEDADTSDPHFMAYKRVAAVFDAAPDAKVERCELCGEPMPDGEEMFKYHGYSGSCPKDERTDYVAWCCYAGGTIRTCDSDTPGAFKVYRIAALATVSEGKGKRG